MAYGLGLKVLHRLCTEQKPFAWRNYKLTASLFGAHEQPAFTWVEQHLSKHHALPQIDTLCSMFPEFKEIETPEPASYYVERLEKGWYYERLNQATLATHNLLKQDQDAHGEAESLLRKALNEIQQHRYRMRILNVGQEGMKQVLTAYHNVALQEDVSVLGWPFLDDQSGGGMPGEIVSFVGRPAAGKTWLTLWTAIANWLAGKKVLFVSMEMATLPVLQRIVGIYTHCNVTQMKVGGYSQHTYMKFTAGLKGLHKEQGEFYVVDGNLAASVEDIYSLADELQCTTIVIDGGYLVRHRNPRLNRFERVAENCELMKRYTGELGRCTTVSWQLNREAAKKQKATGKADPSLEDIGYSDAIAQVSSVVLGLLQEDGIETMLSRKVRVMKGRNGEVGEFEIKWDFAAMDFGQLTPAVGAVPEESSELQWI